MLYVGIVQYLEVCEEIIDQCYSFNIFLNLPKGLMKKALLNQQQIS